MGLKRRLFRDFAADRSGAMEALEFAIVGPTFIAMIMSLFEMGMMMTKIALLDYAVSDASKFIYTGAVQDGTPTQAEIADYICDKAIVFAGCKSNIAVELTAISDFSAPPNDDAPCVDSDSEELDPVVSYGTGNGSTIMYMRVCVTTDVFTPGLGVGLNLAKTDTGRAQVVSAVAFMNEPF